MELKQQLRQTIDFLPEDIIRAFYLIAMEHVRLNGGEKPVRPVPKYDSLAGKIWISDDFDEEMDEYGRFASEPDFGKPVKEVWED